MQSCACKKNKSRRRRKRFYIAVAWHIITITAREQIAVNHRASALMYICLLICLLSLMTHHCVSEMTSGMPSMRHYFSHAALCRCVVVAGATLAVVRFQLKRERRFLNVPVYLTHNELINVKTERQSISNSFMLCFHE